MSWGETIYLKNVIEGKKIFVGSVGTILKEGTEITPHLDGALCFVVEVSNTTAISNVYFDVYEDEVQLTSSSINIPYGELVQLVIPFNVKKGKKYELIRRIQSITINSAYVGGQITDYNYFD